MCEMLGFGVGVRERMGGSLSLSRVVFVPFFCKYDQWVVLKMNFVFSKVSILKPTARKVLGIHRLLSVLTKPVPRTEYSVR